MTLLQRIFGKRVYEYKVLESSHEDFEYNLNLYIQDGEWKIESMHRYKDLSIALLKKRIK